LVRLSTPPALQEIQNKTINDDLFRILDLLPSAVVDLLIVDPPYNLSKSFNGRAFRRVSTHDYQRWLESWLPPLIRTLKPSGSVYLFGDWRSSAAIQSVAERHLVLRNRITWEREKGRGAARNWKNCHEDVWFCTKSDEYKFNVQSVKLIRRVLAPYRDANGKPKDWVSSTQGRHRLTYPSNIWTDMTVPFWSMAENTNHPAQKPEKLLARLILASSDAGDLVLDPFLGSGTTSVVAKKLGRRYIGIEIDQEYCCLTEKRLVLAESDRSIQGYADGVFWERNSQPGRTTDHLSPSQAALPMLFQ
jgi:site-specific DNA-methyltransferase (adenine-specific)